jgi:hypothetical protein
VLAPDDKNANKGTERGRWMIGKSLEECGAGRSIVVDKHGNVIAGNKTLEAWAEISDALLFVHTDGNQLVVVQRDDIDLQDDQGKARALAYFDNRTGEVGLEWDTDEIIKSLEAGLDLTDMWFETEIERFIVDAKTLSSTTDETQDPMVESSREMIHCPSCGHEFEKGAKTNTF